MRPLLVLLILLFAYPAISGTTYQGAVGSGASFLPESTQVPGGGDPPPPPTANCSDGSTCLCDTINDTYPEVFSCIDFEDVGLAGVGGPGVWDTLYNPSEIYADGFQCVVGSCSAGSCGSGESPGPPYYVGFYGDSVAQSSGKDCLAHVYEGNCEVAGETDCVEDGSGGTYSLGHRFGPATTLRNHGFSGGVSFPRVTQMGVTMLMKFSANYVTPPIAQKTNEWGDSASPIFGASIWQSFQTGEVPRNHPFAAGLLTGNGAVLFTPQRNIATIGLTGVNSLGSYYGPDPSIYSWNTHWGPGQWGCWQWHISSVGSLTSPVRVWFTPVGGARTLIFSGGIDTSDLLNSDELGFNKMRFDNYDNDKGVQQAAVAHRLEDNIVMTSAAEPVPCGAISSSF